MSKIILEFDDVEEREDALNAINGFKWKMVVYELDQYYRGVYKYSEVDSEIEMAEKVRDEIMEVLRNNELFL